MALQHCHNRMIGYSPAEILYKVSKFDILSRALKINFNDVVKKSDLERKVAINNVNKKRKKLDLSIGSIVYRRNEICNKGEGNWVGPYTLKEKLNDHKIIIENGFHTIRMNMRKVRPF